MPRASTPPAAASTPDWIEGTCVRRSGWLGPHRELRWPVHVLGRRQAPRGTAATRRRWTSISTLRTPRRIPTPTAETSQASRRRIRPRTLPTRACASTSRRPSTTPTQRRCPAPARLRVQRQHGLRLVDRLHGFTITGRQCQPDRERTRTPERLYNPQCIADSGWYTFKHTFSDEDRLPQGRDGDHSRRQHRPVPSWTARRVTIAGLDRQRGPSAATGTAGSRTRRSSACRSTTRR